MVIHACSQRSSPVKNRMREICTSGSVGGEGGNILAYPAGKLRIRGHPSRRALRALLRMRSEDDQPLRQFRVRPDGAADFAVRILARIERGRAFSVAIQHLGGNWRVGGVEVIGRLHPNVALGGKIDTDSGE